MPAGLRWLSLCCLAAAALTLAVLIFGPQEGLETLAGGLLAVFVLALHIPAGLIFIVAGRRFARRSLSYWPMVCYFAAIWAVGAYQYVVINDIDDSAMALLESKTDADSFQLRELGRSLYRDVVMERAPSAQALIEWRDLALTATEVNRRDEQRLPALWYAAGIGDVEMIERLLTRGARTDDPALYPTPPLAQAVRHDQVAAVRALLEAGADPDVGLNAQTPPLSLAAKNQNLAIARLLLAHDVSVDLGSPTAFTIAVRSGSTDIVAALLDANAQPELQPFSGFPLEIALQDGHAALAELLFERTPGFETQSERRDPLLFRPVRQCDLATFERYLSLGASANVENRRQTPILTYLIRMNFKNCKDLAGFAEALLKSGAAAQPQDLLEALQRGKTAIARALLAHDVSTDGELNKKNFLMLAAQAGELSMVRTALDQGFDVNAWSTGMNNSNALYAAAGAGRAEVVALLFQRGAQLPTESIKLRKLFRFAAPHLDVLNLLLSRHQAAGALDRQRTRDIVRSVVASKDEAAISMLATYGLQTSG